MMATRFPPEFQLEFARVDRVPHSMPEPIHDVNPHLVVATGGIDPNKSSVEACRNRQIAAFLAAKWKTRSETNS
jgi:hypothetical protein